MTCKKAQAFLAGLGWELGDSVVDASKTRMGETEAVKLARSSSKIIIAKGKSVTVLDLASKKVPDGELAALLMGPTGNLRAPTLKQGSTLVVGFSEDAYKEVLGA
jgi:arsenate reductase-like glutaredoxin family protein